MTDTTQLEKLTPVIVEEDDRGGAVAVFPVEKEQKGDRRVGRDPDDEGEDAGDDGADAGGSRNSRRGRARRERARQAKEQRETQITELTSIVSGQQRMLASLARGQQEQALQTLAREGDQAKSAFAEAQRVYAEAIEKGDGQKAAEAQTVMRNAETYYGQVAANYNRIATEARKTAPAADDDQGGDDQQGGNGTRQRQPNVPKLNRKAEDLKADFLDAHPWIDLDKRDATTAAILVIDAEVIKEGFAPDSKDYWDELSERLQEQMPHKFEGNQTVNRERERDRNEDTDDNGRRRGGPPLGGGGDRGRNNGGGNKIQLSPAMVAALDEANIPLTGGDETIVKRRNNILKSWKENAPQR